MEVELLSHFLIYLCSTHHALGLQGKHEGWGSFGEPSGAEVYVMGISHAEFGPRGLRREFVLFDETAIWKQIVMQTG